MLCLCSAWLACCGAAAATEPASPHKPPESKTVDVVDEYHGQKVADPYRWLEKTDDSDVETWLDAQTAYTRAYLDRFADRQTIKERLEKLYAAETSSPPSVYRDRYFFNRRKGSQNHAVLFVRDGDYKAEPRVVIDPNTFSADGTIALDWTSISPDGSLIAYGKSAGGDERSTLYIRNVATGEQLSEEIPQTRYSSIAWLPDNKSFYYTRYPIVGSVPTGDENYFRKVYYHRIGEDWKNDRLVVGELAQKEEFVSPGANSTNEWMFLTRSVDWSKNDLYFRPLASDEPFRPIAVGLDALTSADLVYGKLFILTNHGASRYRLMIADPEKPTTADWRELIPQQKGVIESFRVIDRRIIINVLEDAHTRIFIHDLEGKRIGEIELPTLGSAGGISGEWDDTEIFFGFESFAYPPANFRYDLKTGQLEKIEQVDIGVNVADYEASQQWVTSKDGTRVPMFVVHRKGVERSGRNPTLLYGYGGFDISITPQFRKGLFVWLDRGGVYASACLRGGGEFGADWHLAGRLEKKQNVFDDFIAAAETLISLKYTDRDHLAIYGGSNGGLLVGACMVQRPDLYRAVICAVPLLDMLRYHQFEIARLWIPEYGSADDPKQFEWLRAYSPYHNVKPGTSYPATLIMTGDSDSRVHPLHAWKMAARLQAATSSDRPILMRMDRKAGHGAGKPLSKIVDAESDQWVFLMNELGVFDQTTETGKPATTTD
ncbi:MAG: S9 family peptidase [Phycisphaerales bacterium]|nr:S9 family peptidase [Phycisphaerales bacterium]